MNRNEKIALAFTIILLASIGIFAYFYYFNPQPITFQFGDQFTQKAETPYGESLEIKLNVGGQTTSESASWLASYQDSTSQNVYTVNGVYKSQEQVTLSYGLSVSYANVENIKATVKIKAIDSSDSSSYEYVLANAKSLSGASPISDSGSTQVSITQHLTDAQASTTSATINYEVYCQVTATGTVSGQTLTATIPYTQFDSLTYEQSTESASADVSPTVSVASWQEDLKKPEYLTIIGLVVLLVILLIIPKKHSESSEKKTRKKKGSKGTKKSS